MLGQGWIRAWHGHSSPLAIASRGSAARYPSRALATLQFVAKRFQLQLKMTRLSQG